MLQAAAAASRSNGKNRRYMLRFYGVRPSAALRRHSPGVGGDWPEDRCAAARGLVSCLQDGPVSTRASFGVTLIGIIGLTTGMAAAVVFWLILTQPLDLAQVLVGLF